MVVWIQSLFNLFGAREVADGTGLLLNDRLANLPVDPARPNALRPGHKPLHTLNTFMVCEAGRPILAGATPGGQNGAYLLTTTTVHDDSAADELWGDLTP